MTPKVRLIEIDTAHAGQRLDNFLLRVCKGVPKSHIYKSIRSGQVRVNKGRSAVTYRLQEGDVVRVPPMRLPQPGQERPAPPAAFPVIYEDDALLVINKPAGVAVHGGSGVSFGVIEQLRAARPDAPFLELVHRLDRETSGVLMIAKQRRALVALHDMLRAAQGHRYYEAIVAGDWVNDRQHLRQPLLKWVADHGERRVKVDPLGKQAHTIITLKKRFGHYSWLKAELRTGRTHQIRVHLAAAGFPVLGDDKYGPDDLRESLAARGYKGMFLHATGLKMPHPVTAEPMVFTADLPAMFVRLINELENRA